MALVLGLESSLELFPGAYGSAFDPASISGLAFWLDSARGVTQAGTVTQWVDQVGSRAFVPTGSAPTYSSSGITGHPKITIAANNGMSGASPISGSGDRTIAFVQQSVGVGISTTGVLASFSSVSAGWEVRYDSMFATDGDAASYVNKGTYAVLDNSPHIIIASYSVGTISAYYQDGHTIPLTTSSASGSPANNTMLVGKGIGTTDWHGDMYSVLVYSRVLSLGEQLTLARGLGSLYGITTA